MKIPERYNIVKNKDLRAELWEKGYIVIDNFLDENQLAEFKKIHTKYHVDVEAAMPWFSSAFSSDMEYRKEMHFQLKPIFEKSVEQYFTDYKYLCGGNYFIKKAGESQAVPVHQDSAYIDEVGHLNLTAWAPLQETNAKNGTLQMLDKSHRFFPPYRASALQPYYRGRDAITMKYLKPIDLKPGQVLIFHQSSIHYSAPNPTKNERVSVGFMLAGKGADVITFHKNNALVNSKIEVYLQSEGYMWQHPNHLEDPSFTKQNGKFLGNLDFDFNPNAISDGDYEKMCQGDESLFFDEIPLNLKKPGLVHRLKQFISKDL